MSDIRHINEHYALIGADLIEKEQVLEDIEDVTIVYLSSEAEKKQNGKIIFAQCEKVPDKYKWCVPCDFTITIFEPNVEGFSEKQLRILILHELMHVGIDDNGSYYVKPHDIEDFNLIINRYGKDWALKQGEFVADIDEEHFTEA